MIGKTNAAKASSAAAVYKIYGVSIDLTNKNPLTAVTYTDDAVGMAIGSSEWDRFFGHYPVLLNAGVEGKELKAANFAQFVDGTTADITSGSAGDVMTAFPIRGLKITTTGTTLTVKMTDNPNSADFEYLAHTKGSVKKDKFYLGVYKGYNLSSKLRSLSGKTITRGLTLATARTLAQANGTGYEQSGWYQLIYRQCMYLLKYKNLNSQTAIGQGITSGSTYVATGGSNARGMDYGSTSTTTQVKLFGIEDFWGNAAEWIDGIIINSTRHILTATTGFNDTGSGYEDQGVGATSNIANFISAPHGGTKTGFAPKTVTGSATTYFCDYASLYASSGCTYGGAYYDGTSSGIFRLSLSTAVTTPAEGARLMYL